MAVERRRGGHWTLWTRHEAITSDQEQRMYHTISAVSCSIVSTIGFHNHGQEKAPTRACSWLKAAITAFTFKTLLRQYAKRALTPLSLNVKLGPRCNYHKGQAVWLA